MRRQLADVEGTLARLEDQADEVEEIDIAEVDIEDAAFESLLVGRKVKVLLQDVDQIRWKQDLIEDRNRLATLHAAACQVTATRDAKLAELRSVIERKRRHPINPANHKVIVFTAFADTARYLYEELAPWARAELEAGGCSRHRHRWEPDDPAAAAQGPGIDPHRVRAAHQGTARRSRRGRRDRPADRDRLHFGRSEPAGLRLAHQLRHPLESGTDHSALRAHRPDRRPQ